MTETNRNAQYVKEAKPNSYYAKSFQPVTVDEMKGFFGCRIAMECLLYKDRYGPYWRNMDNPLTVTSGIPEIMPRNLSLRFGVFFIVWMKEIRVLIKMIKFINQGQSLPTS